MQVISKDADLRMKQPELIEEFFVDLGTSMLTLLQFVTLDSLATVYFPLIVERPILLFYFMPMLIFVSIGLMNLITAVSRLQF